MPTYVIDQNMMQNPAFVQKPVLTTLIAREPNALFVVPDVAFVEMSKHEDWELTMRLALGQFAPALERTFLSLSVGEAMSVEMESSHAIEASSLLPNEFNAFVRSLIAELVENREGPSKTSIRTKFSDTRKALLENELNQDSAKAVITKLADTWVTGLRREILKAMRNGTYDERFRLCFIKVNAEQFCLKYLVATGMSEDGAEAFIAESPMVLRHFYLITRHSLAWAIHGSVDQVRAHKELNNQLDQEYVLIASFFDDLLTADIKARKAYEDLMSILDMTTREAVAYVNAVLIQPDPSECLAAG